jgi:hypothetical protein
MLDFLAVLFMTLLTTTGIAILVLLWGFLLYVVIIASNELWKARRRNRF